MEQGSKFDKEQYKNLTENWSTPTTRLNRKNLLRSSKLKHLSHPERYLGSSASYLVLLWGRC